LEIEILRGVEDFDAAVSKICFSGNERGGLAINKLA